MNPKTSQDLFNKIRSQFSNIKIGDETGGATADPSKAVFFEFEFQPDSDTFGSVSVSIADGENMKVFYNRDLVEKIEEEDRDEWYAFLKELKDFAVEHSLRFDVRDITKSNLTKQDYQNIADTNKTVNTDDMNEDMKASAFKGRGGSTLAVRTINKYADEVGEDSMDYDMFKKSAELLDKQMLKSLAQHIENSDTSPREYVMKTIADKDPETFKKMYGDQEGFLSVMKPEKDLTDAELERIEKLSGLAEGLTGTSRRSYENLDKTRLIIRHTGTVDETIPGARSRQIQSLYIENEDGERFKYPLTHLAGARAMTRHVSNGGRPHDEFGEHIIKTSEDIAKLNSFSRFVSNKDQLNDNAGDIIEQTKLKLENLRMYMRNLSKQGHYETASKDFKTADEVVLDDETANTYKDKFTMRNLDSRVEEALPIIHKIMSELEKPVDEEQPVVELEPGDEPIDAPIEPPVDHGGIVTSFLTDPENKLVLRKDASADKLLTATRFKDKNTMLSSIMSDIAERMLTKTGEEDRIANFASRVADGLDQEKSAAFKPTPDYIKNKKIAIQLAKRYIDDYKKMQKDPGFADEIRMDPADYNPKKDIKGKAKETEEFESWVENIDKDQEDKKEKLKALQDIQMDKHTSKDPELQKELMKRKAELTQEEPAFAGEQVTFEDIKPYVSMYKGKDGKMVHDVLDKDGNSVFKTGDAKTAMQYLAKNFTKLRDKESRKESNAELDRIKTLASI